jgi:tetratricopeptide (TPR) repeat protein
VAWQIAAMPTQDVLSELGWRGIAFTPDNAHLDLLKDARLAPEVLAALPDAPSAGDPSAGSEVPRIMIDAGQAFDAKDYAAARRSLESLILQEPNADLYVALGNLNFVTGDLPSAKDAFLKAEQLDPVFIYVHVRLAGIYYRLEQVSEMILEAGKALRLQPDNAQARKYLAVGAVMGKPGSEGSYADPDGTDVQNVSKLKPGKNQEAKDLYTKGNTLLKEEKYPEAEADYLRAIDLDPDVAVYYYNLGNAYWHDLGPSGSDKWEPAFRQAISLVPRNLSIRQNLGHALCQSGHHEEAVTVFRELLNIDPKWNMARPCLVESLKNLGRTDEAHQVTLDYWRYHGINDDSSTGPNR